MFGVKNQLFVEFSSLETVVPNNFFSSLSIKQILPLILLHKISILKICFQMLNLQLFLLNLVILDKLSTTTCTD